MATASWPTGRRGALALPAGALPALAFPEPGLWWLAWVALVPWLFLLRTARGPREAALTGWLGGTGLILAVHHWLLPSLHVFLLLLAPLMGALWAPWGVLVRRLLGGRPGTGRLLAAAGLIPAGWLLIELVRSWEYLGGPWGLLGASQWQVEPALRAASLGGVWLVSVAVVAVNTGVTALLTVAGARLPATGVLLALSLLTGAVWVGAPDPEPAGTARVAVVQPGLSKAPSARFRESERLTRELAGRQPDLVVWGESSVGVDLGGRPADRARLTALSSEVGAGVLVNVDARRVGGPGIYKTSVLARPGGLARERYDKTRLVPFGEYIPARSLLGWATSVGKAAGEDRRRGTGPVLMRSDGVVFGPLICFESAFPDMSARLTRDGARLLVAQSSTSSFQGSWAPEQHASLGALRAAETGRPMVHATLTGQSAVYGPGGESLGRLGTDQRGTLVREVPLASGTTPYVRYGDWVPGLALLAVAGFCALEGVRALRARRGRSARTPDTGPPGPTVSTPAPR
ncbi:apolipoprotein N-acyltransferase [Streptomyces sp. AJS327]|uniref:apolipoprotein N-acyltransferase n=1 Tax=Streptomyces sp. AJS327 TaxID=2545265 RepID=UPI0015DFFCAF|nr:apolipoprotein N-acyltransferase [Streptomyces sp. AJS327]MBA0051090.1 apolipoprotein N-acyltransferase [Streptomyces sp. AJS327]